MAVYVIDELDVFKEGARIARLKLFQERPVEGGVEVRMKAGRLGFQKVYRTEGNRKDKEEYEKVKSFIEIEEFVEVKSVEADDTFFV